MRSPNPLRLLFLLTTTAVLGLSAPALAQDDDIFSDDEEFEWEGEDDGTQDDSNRLEEGDDLDNIEENEDELEGFQDGTDEDGEPLPDLLGEDGQMPASQSNDSAQIYRDTAEEAESLAADEQIQLWEQYLTDYPNTPFRERISRRIADLEIDLYDTRIGGGEGAVDAMDLELNFAQSNLLESIDPRTRLRAGVELGLPNYFNPHLDYQHAFNRKFAIHIGARQRYTGYGIEPGVRWALIKSTRTQSILTFQGDLHVNANPAWFGLRPGLAFGKRFGDKLDAQFQAGTELELRSVLGMRILGGMAAHYAASDTVQIFLEADAHMKGLTRDGGFFRFNVMSFGMKFYPKRSDDGVDPNSDVNMGATVPYSYNYWQFNYGSVLVNTNRYFD